MRGSEQVEDEIDQSRTELESEYLLSVLDALPHSIMVIGTDYRVKLVNATAKRLQSHNNQTLEDARCYKLLHERDTPCDGAGHPCPLKRVVETGEPQVMIHKHRCGDGRHMVVEMEATPIFDSEGEVSGIIECVKDITARVEREIQHKKKVAKLSAMAHQDPLTALPNRLLFMDRLKHAIAGASRKDRLLSVMYVDLDDFKSVNDTLGHDVGDSLLCAVADRLQECLRKSDTLARLGGDEFTIILDDPREIGSIIQVARKILEVFTQPFWVSDSKLHVTASIGISLFPEDAGSAEEMLKSADAAMYDAKKARKNTYKFYRQGSLADMRKRRLERLDSPLGSGDFRS